MTMLPIRIGRHLLQLLAVVTIIAESEHNIKVQAQNSSHDPTSSGASTNPNSSAERFPQVSSWYTTTDNNVGNTEIPSDFSDKGDSQTPDPNMNLLNSVLLNLQNELPAFLFNMGSSVPKNRCQADVNRAINSAKSKELWAMQMFDSWGKPSNSILKFELNTVGSYDQCRGMVSPSQLENRTDSYRGNYCVLNVAPFLDGRVSNLVNFQFGICMPDTCSEDDITDMANVVFKELSLAENITAKSTECRNEDREVTTTTIISIVLLTVVGSLMLTGTILDIVFVQWPKWAAPSSKTGQLPAESNNPEPDLNSHQEKSQESNDKGQSALSKSTLLSINEEKLTAMNGETTSYPNGETHFLILKEHQHWIESLPAKVLLSFSAYTNGANLLDTSQKPGSMTAINGLRVITMMWIYISHLQTSGYLFSNFTNYWSQHVFHTRRLDFLTNGTPSVDTFFSISGLLVSYCLYNEVMTVGWKMNWKKIIFHRFWRLTPPYMAVVLLVLGMQRFMGSGSMWATTQPAYKLVCEKNWWTHLLYINNFYDPYQTCSIHFWYLAVDMQLFLLIPFLLIPFYYNRYAGLGSCGFFLVLSWIIAGALSSYNEWAASLSQFVSPLMRVERESLYSAERFVYYFIHYYQATYCRAGPFLIGFIAGHFLAVNKGRIPLRWDISILCWVIALASGIAVVYGIHDELVVKYLNNSTSAFYNAMARSIWSVCVCWVIIACASGYGGPINVMLSWSPFTVLSRLTYMVYLIQMSTIEVYLGNMEQIITMTSINILITFLGLIMVSTVISFALVLAFETPFMKLEKVIF